MKFLLFVAINISFVTPILAQVFEAYMEEKGIRVAAFCAHPGTRFLPDQSSTYVFHDEVFFDIRYDSDIQTVMKVNLQGGIIENVELLHDSHWYPAFANALMLEGALGVPTEQVDKDNLKKIRLYYERLYKKPTSQFSGLELTAGVLSYQYALYAADKHTSKYSMLRSSNPEVVQRVNGISIEGTRLFVQTVTQALDIIREYDPHLYTTYFAHSNDKFNLIKGIAVNERLNISTIDEGWYLVLSKDFAIKRWSPYQLASTIVHEFRHLYQYYAYTLAFNSTAYGFLASYAHDPVRIADVEIEANESQLSFLQKILANKTSPGLAIAKEEFTLANKRIDLYELVREAGGWMFESRDLDPSCGSNCMRLACDTFQPFKNDEYMKTAQGHVQQLNSLLCAPGP